MGNVVVVVRMHIRTCTRGEGQGQKKPENQAIRAWFWVDPGCGLGMGGSVVLQGPMLL